jgi:hypothetical protein
MQYILILSSQLLSVLPSGPFPSDFVFYRSYTRNNLGLPDEDHFLIASCDADYNKGIIFLGE